MNLDADIAVLADGRSAHRRRTSRRAVTKKGVIAEVDGRLGNTVATPVALHEAGHAVVAALFGVAVHEIHIGRDPDQDTRGATLLGEFSDWRHEAVVSAAGLEAQLTYTPPAWRGIALLGADGDSKRIRLLLMENIRGARARRAEERRLRRVARGLVKQHWASVLDVAELALCGDFDGDYQIHFEIFPKNGFDRSAVNAFRRDFENASTAVDGANPATGGSPDSIFFEKENGTSAMTTSATGA